ncbi:MAG: hypothetical protein ACJ76Y_05985 [Thermoanaerobaculia bacterium]
MRSKGFLLALTVLLVLAAGCKAHEPENPPPAASTATPPTAAAPSTSTAPAPATTAPAPTATPPPATAAAPATSAAAPAPAAALASQQTNWPGIVADVIEFRRKGSTLTAKVVLRNQGNVDSQPDIHYNELYVMDLGAGKKYEVLKDEKGNYIAALRSGYRDQWYQRLQPGETYTIWMKLPAPPPDVKTVTLQIPGVPPFEDLAIQDS